MLSTEETERVLSSLSGGVDKLPDAFFGLNSLEIGFPSRQLRIEFSPQECLQCCTILESSPFTAPFDEYRPQIPQVKHAATWAKTIEKCKASSIDVRSLTYTYDWTYSSKYWGSIFKKDKPVGISEAEGCDGPDELPLAKLSDNSVPILWFQQIDLFDDDLSDSGITRADVKIRVMPDFWFVLMRQEIRVDSVLLRQVNTRFFHEFGSPHILRQFSWKEASFDELEARGHKFGPGSSSVDHINVGTQLLSEDDTKLKVQYRFLL